MAQEGLQRQADRTQMARRPWTPVLSPGAAPQTSTAQAVVSLKRKHREMTNAAAETKSKAWCNAAAKESNAAQTHVAARMEKMEAILRQERQTEGAADCNTGSVQPFARGHQFGEFSGSDFGRRAKKQAGENSQAAVARIPAGIGCEREATVFAQSEIERWTASLSIHGVRGGGGVRRAEGKGL